MKIGELATRSGLSPSRIRFYEAEGLLNVVSRSANGYREYPADALAILGIIVGAQQTGFSLDEIRDLLPENLQNWHQAELTAALRAKIAHIERMQLRLVESKRQLQTLIGRIESKPKGISCEGNTKRLLKEFAGSEPRRDDAEADTRARRPASRAKAIARTSRPA